MHTKEFTARQPSRAQVTKAIKDALKAGHTDIEIGWGENRIGVWKGRSGEIHGWGWIGRTGGHDVAQEIDLERRQAIKN